jgi:hypothetical protein
VIGSPWLDAISQDQSENVLNPLTDPSIIAELRRAWRESQPDDPVNRHEEGGYILLNPDLSYGVERWSRGGQFLITPLPLDSTNCYNGSVVASTFHTHPNPPLDEDGREWEQAPSESDRRWHARRKLQGIVISRVLIYEIDVNANVFVFGRSDEVLAP